MKNNILDFFHDSVKTFLYFALSPFQFLFFKMPRVYEAAVTIILFIKSLIPTKEELQYTWLCWRYFFFINILNLTCLILKVLSITAQLLKVYIEKLLIKTDKIKYSI